MPSEESISFWLDRLKAGDAAGAQPLWESYFQRLVGLARARLRSGPRRAADEEDVALSAFDSFCRGAQQGKFPQLADRDDLWRLLVTITERKAARQLRHEHRLKRGGAAVISSDTAAHGGRDSVVAGIEQIAGREPTPEFAAQVADECRRLLACLDNDDLRSIALWKMEGETVEEIAERLGRAPRTVERKLRLIRGQWQQETGS
jgi:DNA-directed RNA polymerase specialized sigma24 family protein